MKCVYTVVVIGLIAAAAAPQEGTKAPSAPAWPAPYTELKVLNNFVTELLAVPSQVPRQTEYAFSNPRTGWVFIAVNDLPDSSAVYLDGRAEALVWRPNPLTGAREAMQYLAEGQHRLRVENDRDYRLDIRAVPELAYCYYPATPHIAPYGPYDWAYTARHVLPHVNVLITRSDAPKEQIDEWLREGRRWIGNASLPGLNQPDAPTAESVYEIWAANPGVTQPEFSGLIVDEFFGGTPDHYRAWTDAVRKLHENPSFKNKVYYAWCGDLYHQQHSLLFSRALVEMGYRFSWEKYLAEEPAEEKARRSIGVSLAKAMDAWRKAMPGIERNMVMCLGYLSAPPESLNTNPGVDYQVFLDMQFHAMANEPAFWNLYGVMEYMANYADEESLRYAHELFRHYCIDGKRERYNNDPYILPHLQNPDFADGLDGWRAEPAGKGSLKTRSMKGFSWLQGRYPETREGDKFCWMKRSTQKPNRVTQSLKALEPGRLYSVKLITADLAKLDQNKETTVSIEVTGAEILKEYGLRFAYPSCYSHEVEPYTKDHPAYMTLHRIVFRAPAKSGSSTLIITDWTSPSEPGGPAGQEIAFNFVEVQPFHAPK